MSTKLAGAAVITAALVLVQGARLTITAAGGIDVLTHHNDAARTGQNLNETVLTPANVNMTSFGKVGFFSVDGRVDAQPLFLSGVVIAGQGTHNVLYVATEHDSVYAFDGNTGAVLWRVSLLGTGEVPSDNRGCSQVTPEMGITSTPVIDRTRGPSGAIYVIAMSKDATGHYFQRLHALDVATGAELFRGREDYSGVFPGNWRRERRRRGDLRPEAVQGTGRAASGQRIDRHIVGLALRYRSLHWLDHGLRRVHPRADRRPERHTKRLGGRLLDGGRRAGGG